MNKKLRQELNRYALIFGVTPADILGRDSRIQGVAAARRAVWSKMLIRGFTLDELTEMFGRTPSMIRMGVKMHREHLPVWPRQRHPGGAVRRPGEPEIAFLIRRRTSLRNTFAKLDPKRETVRREEIIAECKSITDRLRELKETPCEPS